MARIKSAVSMILPFSLSQLLKQAVIVLFLVQLAGAAAAGELLRLEQSAEAMGSTYSIAVYGDDQAKLESAVEEAFEEARRLDGLLSNYKADSEWSLVNKNAAAGPIMVSPELFNLLNACSNYSRASEGAFDITVGPLMRVWGFYKGTGHLPQGAEVETARTHIGYQFMEFNPAEHTVRFKKAGLEMDPGGIGKGYAVDKMVAVLRRKGIASGLVSASGSSIYAMGTPPGQDGWHIDIKDPRDPARKPVTEVVLKEESMSTSGSYEKFFEADGRVYSHIMDPRTGYPAQGMLSVSVIAPRTIDSEAWAKPMFINGRSWSAAHKPQNMRAFFCEDKVNQSCMWVQ